MNWVDVAGPPGCGKSTLCYKNSDGSDLWGDKSVTWDGKPPPPYWRPFLDEIGSLMRLIDDHPGMQKRLGPNGELRPSTVEGMNDRSIKKMATVERMDDPRCFVQTGLVQRILGFGWRLEEMGRDINLIRRALWLIPVSVGVAFLEADIETLLARNRKREETAATAHENRSHQVPLMLPSIALAKEVLNARGIPVCSIDVAGQTVDGAREALLAFAGQEPCDAAAIRSGCEMAVFSSPPPWWRSGR